MSSQPSSGSTNRVNQPSDETSPLPIPSLLQQERRFILNQSSRTDQHDKVAKDLLEGIINDEMGPFLETILKSDSETISEKFKRIVPEELLSNLKKKNQETLDLLELKLKESNEDLGETEISDVLKSKAIYLSRIGDKKEKGIKGFEEALEKQAGLGSKIDLRLSLIRLGFFHSDHQLIIDQIAKTKELVDSGGDWDRRNRLKVYQAMNFMAVRNFKEATPLLLDTLSTFTATELLSYEDFVTLANISAALTLERKDMKKKIIESPEVIQIIPERPHLHAMVCAIYNTEYDKFFIELAKVEQVYLLPSRFLSIHARFYVREMRIKAYSQLLESYRSVSLKSMASAFGVTEEFIDSELARFIAAGRLNCSIDKVNGIVETKRSDGKNLMYSSVVKNGDALLNSIQKLSRVIG
ncbi:26S proteasome regulatory subunit N7 [Phakopsora pachyrhizi]|uniref:26S proteasome regulatory subunit N7 n=1 Tax=Phakopsora pachyrhizi TaxID=170000 RepID=A0AAV0AZE7_PHAPC|nr:26S proteasome regulatory subunit N7 [Phakopsora pachyrhizi]CAH7675234.1 26S proteasome regulatory subunit N7 [Phakopsora pachyrhizi]